ncbi:MAG: SGNH/GDSL hydrolase family protein [Clostridia bacterium]|nr:SGNH/GDSL hydrolase family protein [Clostridia bacterium]
MKILFYGDSITDMCRIRESDDTPHAYGLGYPNFVAGELLAKNPQAYEIINRGIGGNVLADLYARIKADVWNHTPDVLSILIGINDIWREIDFGSGTELPRWEKLYRMLIEDTLARLPNVKIIIMEPFVLRGTATQAKFSQFEQIYEYAAVAKKLAEEYKMYFLPLQQKLNDAAKRVGAARILYDGVHPDSAGAYTIAQEWLKLFNEKVVG